jgi:lipoprotein-releasing system ATP-binding protein
MIKATNISKSFGDLNVLKDLSISVNQSEIVSIVGKSGAGKTTLLQILGTLEKPSNGDIYYEKTNVLTLNENAISKFRNENIGFIFQFHNLLPEFTALENIYLPGLIAKKNKKEVHEKAMHFLNLMGLEKRKNHKPNELSGGEQQRISVARALINNPKVILADEPSGNLDTQSANQLHELFFKLRDTFNQTFIIVTHNTKLAEIADRKVEMKDGQIIN